MHGRNIRSAPCEANRTFVRTIHKHWVDRSPVRARSPGEPFSDRIDLGSGMANYVLSKPQRAIDGGNIVIEKQDDTIPELSLVAPNKHENPQSDPTPEDHRPTDDHQEILKSVE